MDSIQQSYVDAIDKHTKRDPNPEEQEDSKPEDNVEPTLSTIKSVVDDSPESETQQETIPLDKERASEIYQRAKAAYIGEPKIEKKVASLKTLDDYRQQAAATNNKE